MIVRSAFPFSVLILSTTEKCCDVETGVVPLHSFKHISELQYKLPDNPNPLLLRVDTKSGHGAGKVSISSVFIIPVPLIGYVVRRVKALMKRSDAYRVRLSVLKKRVRNSKSSRGYASLRTNGY